MSYRAIFAVDDSLSVHETTLRDGFALLLVDAVLLVDLLSL